MQAQFLTLDGIDGSGKSTHLETMREWFERRGMPVLFTREPGGTPLAVTENNVLVGVIHLKDVVKPNVKERFADLRRMGLRTATAATLADARAQLAQDRFDLCLTDMRLPDGNGIELVTEIARDHPRTPVAMITAFGSMDLAVEALKAGAFDFVSKPVDIAVLRGLVKHALEDAGIPAFVFGESLLGGMGELPLFGVLRVCVPDVALPQARDALAAGGARRVCQHSSPRRCSSCCSGSRCQLRSSAGTQA